MYLDKHTDDLTNLADEIWEYAEIASEEVKSSKAQSDFLKNNGFDVEYDVGFPNSYKATWSNDSGDAVTGKAGKGDTNNNAPTIGFLAEMDALNGLSQKALVTHKEPRDGFSTGHGCGHNLLGVGSIGAALELKSYLEENKLAGTVIVFGCPAEEAISGKKFMADAGTFDCCDVCFAWHPAMINAVARTSSTATLTAKYEFRGTSAHAAASPQSGRNALSAVELMNMGTSMLREHMYKTDLMHHSILDAGSKAPNVIQDFACTSYRLRAKNRKNLDRLCELVSNCAKGAAMMTGTEVDEDINYGSNNIITNTVLEDVLLQSFEDVEPPTYTKEELDFIGSYDIEKSAGGGFNPNMFENPQDIKTIMGNGIMCNGVLRFKHSDEPFSASTDVGNVSWKVPVGQILIANYGLKTTAHSWQWVSQGKGSVAHKGMIYASKILSDAAIKVVNDSELIKKAKAELDAKLKV